MSAAVKIHPMSPVTENTAIVKDINTNFSTGYIALFRSIRKHWIWQDPVKFQWWVDILLEANHKDQKVLIHGTLLECKRGQSLNSLQTWAKRWRTDKSAVRRFFKLLESDSMIETQNVSKTTRLTVCNYDSYNRLRHEDETDMQRRRNAGETPATPNNNDNNANKGLGDVPPPPKPPRKVFVPPTKEEVTEFIKSLTDGNSNSGSVAQNFMNHYGGNGWKVGKNKMVDWQATARNCLTWEKNQLLIANGRPETAQTGDVDFDEFYGRPPIQPAF